MIPLQPPIRLVPVDHPSIIGRVYIARQPPLIAVQLLADKMHLARQHGLVARRAEVVCVCRDVGSDAVRVVVGADLGGQLARHHGHARGRAEGRGAVGGVEDDGGGGEAVEVGGDDLGGGVVHLQEGSGELVGHDVEDVGL